MYPIKVQLENVPGKLGRNLFIWRRTSEGVVEYMKSDGSFSRHERKRGEYLGDIPPTMYLDHEVLQGIVDSLAKAGVKPTEASYVEGKLEATEKHLADMRSLVFEEKIIISGKPS